MPEVFPRAQRSCALPFPPGNRETRRREQPTPGTRRWRLCPSSCHQESKLPLTDLSYNCILFKFLFLIMQIIYKCLLLVKKIKIKVS